MITPRDIVNHLTALLATPPDPLSDGPTRPGQALLQVAQSGASLHAVAAFESLIPEPVALWLRNQTRIRTRETYARRVGYFVVWLAEHGSHGHTVLTADLGDLVLYRDYLSDPDRWTPPLRTATVVAEMRALSSLYTFLLAQNAITVNPFTQLKLPEITDSKTKRAWRLEELGAFFAAIPTNGRGADAVQYARDRALFWLLFRNGLRVGEAVGARIGDLDELDGARILRLREHGRADQHIKRGLSRLAVLKPETAAGIDRYLKLRRVWPGLNAEVRSGAVDWRDLPLFAAARVTGGAARRRRRALDAPPSEEPSETLQEDMSDASSEEYGNDEKASLHSAGAPTGQYTGPGRAGQGKATRAAVWEGLSSRQAEALMRRYGERAGLDSAICHPHAARMTAITALIKAGVDLASVMAFSGHRSIRSVQAYVDLTTSVRDNAAWRVPY